MTNKETIEILKNIKEWLQDEGLQYDVEALEKGIEALENYKTGHWVKISKHSLDGEHPSYDVVKCSECKTHWEYKFNYCPNCGAKMEGE